MKINKGKLLLIATAILIAVVSLLNYRPEVLTTASFNPLQLIGGNFETERNDGYFTLKDEDGNVIHMTALPVYTGDEYIAADNKRYKVSRIDGDTAFVRLVGIEHLAYNPAWDDPKTLSAATGQKNNLKLGVYHTHSDEAYVPTDGKSSIYGKGTIFKVGKTYTQNLQEMGIEVDHSMRPHDPHDANAYNRSRRTATELMRNGADALVDVHRDAVPPQVYAAKVDGKAVTKVKLVVGRRNPRMAANLQFAKSIKAYMDKHKPGLIEGIFMAKGNYNQELSPKAILIEVGSHTNSRQRAQAGVAEFTEAIPAVLGVNPAEAAPQKGGNNAAGQAPVQNRVNNMAVSNDATDRGSWSSLGWIIGALVVGAGLFLLISTGSLKGSMDKVSHFTSKEFTNALGIKKQDKTEQSTDRINKQRSVLTQEEKKDQNRVPED